MQNAYSLPFYNFVDLYFDVYFSLSLLEKCLVDLYKLSLFFWIISMCSDPGFIIKPHDIEFLVSFFIFMFFIYRN